MPIILGAHCDYQRMANRKCAVCGNKVEYPFLHWDSPAAMCICGDCCHEIKRGLTADLIQIAAIVDLQKLGYGGDVTLVRDSNQRLATEAERINRWPVIAEGGSR